MVGPTMMALDHVHVYASDPGATIAFYERYFEAERVGRLPTRDGRSNEFIVLGGQVVVVSAFPPGLEARPAPVLGDGAVQSGFGVSHLGINVSDLDALVAKLRRGGVDVHGEPVTTGAIRYVYLSAPDGVVVELTQYVVPRHLKPALGALNAFNRSVHRARKALTQTLLKLAG